MSVFIDNRATGGLQDGTTAENAYLHPDHIPAVSLAGIYRRIPAPVRSAL